MNPNSDSHGPPPPGFHPDWKSSHQMVAHPDPRDTPQMRAAYHQHINRRQRQNPLIFQQQHNMSRPDVSGIVPPNLYTYSSQHLTLDAQVFVPNGDMSNQQVPSQHFGNAVNAYAGNVLSFNGNNNVGPTYSHFNHGSIAPSQYHPHGYNHHEQQFNVRPHRNTRQNSQGGYPFNQPPRYPTPHTGGQPVQYPPNQPGNTVPQRSFAPQAPLLNLATPPETPSSDNIQPVIQNKAADMTLHLPANASFRGQAPNNFQERSTPQGVSNLHPKSAHANTQDVWLPDGTMFSLGPQDTEFLNEGLTLFGEADLNDDEIQRLSASVPQVKIDEFIAQNPPPGHDPAPNSVDHFRNRANAADNRYNITSNPNANIPDLGLGPLGQGRKRKRDEGV